MNTEDYMGHRLRELQSEWESLDILKKNAEISFKEFVGKWCDANIIQEENRMNRWKHSEYEILETMERFGGSFVKQLALLYRLGDMENRAKILATWPNYFKDYDRDEFYKEVKR